MMKFILLFPSVLSLSPNPSFNIKAQQWMMMIIFLKKKNDDIYDDDHQI